jgi:hypothetical protein
VLLVACAGKLGAGTLAARLSGLSWRESGAMGALMNTRGLMVLIVLNLGLDFGIIDPALFSMLVVMALVTTFAAKPLLDAIYPMGQHIRDLLATESTAEEPPARPDHRVLACIVDPRSSPSLYALARALGGDARVHALALRSPDAPANDDEPSHGNGGVKPMSFASSEPAVDICRMAEVKAADLVLLARRPAAGDGLLGRTSARVMADCSRCVGLLLPSAELRTRDVLLIESGGPHDAAARRIADRLIASGARVIEGGSDVASALVERRGFDLLVTGLPDEDDGRELVRSWLGRGHGASVLVIRGPLQAQQGATA